MAPIPRHLRKWRILLFLWLLRTEYAESKIYQNVNNETIKEFTDLPAQFGPTLSNDGLTVYAGIAEPIDACTPIQPPQRKDYPDKVKFVAIIESAGGDDNCTFEQKVRYAQNATWNAVIVYNNRGDDLIEMSALNSSGIAIASFFVGKTTGMHLKSLITPEVKLYIHEELPNDKISREFTQAFMHMIGWSVLIFILYLCSKQERCCVIGRNRSASNPYDEKLKKMPIVKYNLKNEQDMCVICLDNFVVDEELRVLPCNHSYHRRCIEPWITEERHVCPICNRSIFQSSNRNRKPIPIPAAFGRYASFATTRV